jgi:FAD/FMN-containing dehydrogenase
MSLTSEPTVSGPSSLATALHGKVVRESHSGYDAARQAWNLTIDQRPAAVVAPESPQDVAAAVLFARERGYRVAPPGHGPRGMADGLPGRQRPAAH